ncbi:circadian clock KaiB family protein, partial [Arhodomonas sp. KWT]
MASGYLLRLFIAGHTPRSRRAIADLRQICQEDLGGRYALEVIDVIENPEAAEHEHVVATPTLIKELPPPVRR